MKYFNEINSHKYIFLETINEPKDNSLRLTIRSASAAANKNVEESSCIPIDANEKSITYEIIFETYIGYSVIDESFALPCEDDIFTGKIFCIYEKSTYLNYLKKASFATENHPGAFKHYGFNCLNHVIDIASVEAPIIVAK